MVSLHGFSILILLTQSNHKSALLFSCTCPFSGACGYYTTFFLKSQTYVHIFLRKIKKFFRSYPQYERGSGGITNKHAATLQRKPARRERKRRSASGSARTPFRGGHFCRCVFFLCRPFGNGGLSSSFVRLHSDLFLGVSLSAAARSAAALVYDKLTPNCHLLNLIWKKADINYGACLYVCIEFSIISKRAVQRIVPLPDARFPVIDSTSAYSEFRAHFGLPHTVHVAIQDSEFQSG